MDVSVSSHKELKPHNMNTNYLTSAHENTFMLSHINDSVMKDLDIIRKIPILTLIINSPKPQKVIWKNMDPTMTWT